MLTLKNPTLTTGSSVLPYVTLCGIACVFMLRIKCKAYILGNRYHVTGHKSDRVFHISHLKHVPEDKLQSTGLRLLPNEVLYLVWAIIPGLGYTKRHEKVRFFIISKSRMQPLLAHINGVRTKLFSSKLRRKVTRYYSKQAVVFRPKIGSNNPFSL